jgi:hypothetical protein
MSQEDEKQDDKKSLSERAKERTARVKQHLKDNRQVYLAAAGGAVIGGTIVGAISLRRVGFQMPEIQQTAKNTALVVWKSPPTNIALVREACPDPIPVLDKMTGESYRSITRAMKMTGETIKSISKDVHGDQTRWERLPDSVFA